MFDDLIREGIKRVWEEDTEFQSQAILEICRDIRKYKSLTDEYLLNYFKTIGAFYVPNDDYIKHFFDVELQDFSYGIFKNSGECNYYQRLIIPIYSLDNNIVALCGYANDSGVKYSYSPKTVWEKARYLYLNGDEWKQAVEDKYIFVVDGIFDAISLRLFGYNATCTMGSEYTDYHKKYLSFIKKLIVPHDNDNAGLLLAKKISSSHNNVTIIKQGETKDIDDFIKLLDTVSFEDLTGFKNLSEININVLRLRT